MRNKKLLKFLALSPMMLTTLTGCRGGADVADEVIEVKMYNGGFGKDWFEAIGQKFSEYQSNVNGRSVAVKIVDYSKSIGDKAKQEILTVDGNTTDLYLLDGPDIHEMVRQSEARLGTDEVAILESLDDILDQGAINFDGSVETESIKSRLNKGYDQVIKYHTVARDKWNGYTFTMPWLDAMTGIVCNVQALAQMGLEVPTTTDEFVATVKAIANKGTAVKPFVYSGKDAPGYWNYLYNTWLAQSLGNEQMNKFLACTPNADEEKGAAGDGSIEDISEFGYLIYEQNIDGIANALAPMVEILDSSYCVKNSASATYGDAQSVFADGEAVFMVNGDWLLKEMKDADATYYESIKNYEMIRTPILSSLGSQVGLSTDEELSTLVKMIDEHKTNAEIKEALGNKIDDAGIARIEEARGVYHSEGANHLLLIPSYAEQKDLAKEFVRFMYGNDSCNLYSKYNFANLPVKYTLKESSIMNNYQKSVNKLYDTKNPTMFDERGEVNEVRSMAAIYFFNKREWQGPKGTFTAIMNDKTWTARYIAEQEAEATRIQWPGFMDRLGW